jgi:glycosyltransferase involved in cell wall biosynthesis
LKILIVAHGFPRREGDLAGSFLLALARGQQALGHDVMAVVPHDAGLPMEDVVDGVPVRRYRYGRDAAETLAYRGTMADQVLRSWSGRVRLMSFLRAQRRGVSEAVRAFSPDIVHVHWWFPGGFAVWPWLPGRVPYVLTSHGTDLFLVDRIPLARVIAGPIFRRASETTVISTPLVERAAALGVDRARITVVPMPIDSAAATAANGARDPSRVDGNELLFVGRLVERKGAEFAIRALAELVRSGRPTWLAVVGDGPEREALGVLAKSLGVGGRVEFKGALPSAMVRAHYERASVLLMPAITDWKGEQEGFGMVIVEAMAYGVPVVATRSGGITDIIRDGENGLLVPEADGHALAGAVGRLLDDPALAKRLGEAGRQEVRERFSPDGIAARFDSVYRRAAARPRG